MTRIFRDSTTPADIPLAGLAGVMGYANGAYAWPAAGWQRFAGLPWVRIDVTGADPAADVLDVETGDATPARAPGWARAHHAAAPGYPPVIYCNRAILPAVKAAMAAAGLAPGPGYRIWLATLDGTRTVPDMTGVIAVQYAGQAQTGGHYDETIVYDNRWLPVRRGVLVTGLRTRIVVSRDRAHAWWR